MATIVRFEDIQAWILARELTKLVYAASNRGAFAKDFSLKNQMRDASVSIMSNIAEGFERNGNKEFMQFLSIAKSSCGEVRSELYVASDQNYLTENEYREMRELALRTSAALSSLMGYLQEHDFKGSKFTAQNERNANREKPLNH